MTYQVANYFFQKAKSCNFHTSYFAVWASTNGEAAALALKVGVEDLRTRLSRDCCAAGVTVWEETSLNFYLISLNKEYSYSLDNNKNYYNTIFMKLSQPLYVISKLRIINYLTSLTVFLVFFSLPTSYSTEAVLPHTYLLSLSRNDF